MLLLVILFCYIVLIASILLFISGAVMLTVGIVKRVKTRAAPKPSGSVLIIGGVIMFLSGGIVCGAYGVNKLNNAIEKRNNIYQQLLGGTVEDVERCLKNQDYTPESLGKMLIYFGFGRSDAIEKATLLIEYGADVNVVACPHCTHNNGGYRYELCSSTPLIYVCDYFEPNYEMLKLFIDNGGDVNAIDFFGYSALDIVEKNINDTERFDPEEIEILKQMKELLLENGAKNGPHEMNAESDQNYKFFEKEYDYY